MIVIERPASSTEPKQIWRFEFTVTGGKLRLYLAEYERIPKRGDPQIWRVSRDLSPVSPAPLTKGEYWRLLDMVIDEANCAVESLTFYDGPAVEDEAGVRLAAALRGRVTFCDGPAVEDD